ncbi:MAG: metallophosphoesterase family protein [Gemmatimonadales bacterium]
MRIGVISDTHGLLRASVFDVFADVDHILHAGDVGSQDIITELEGVAPVVAVYGNADGFDLRDALPRVAKVDLTGLLVTLVHGDEFGLPTPAELADAYPDSDVVVYGHTHEPLLEIVGDGLTVLNPGAAGPYTKGMPTVAIVEYEPVLPPRARIVPLTE